MTYFIHTVHDWGMGYILRIISINSKGWVCISLIKLYTNLFSLCLSRCCDLKVSSPKFKSYECIIKTLAI